MDKSRCREHREEDEKEGEMFERTKMGKTRCGNEDTEGEGRDDRGGRVKIKGV